MISAANLIVAMARLPEAPGRTARFAAAVAPVDPARFAVPFTAAFMSTLAFTVIYVVFPLHAGQALGFDRSRVSYLFALVGVMTALDQGGLIGRLSRRYGEGRLVVAGGLLMTIGLAGLAMTVEGTWMLYPGLIALGIGFGLAGPAEAGYVSRLASPENQGRILGMLQSANSVPGCSARWQPALPWPREERPARSTPPFQLFLHIDHLSPLTS